MSTEKKPSRYADADLLEFKNLLQKKLDKCHLERTSLREQITELGEKMGDDRSDFVDSTNSQSEGEMLRTMLHRVEKYYRDLENAMTRIRNKSYGICSVTGELIDKRRLIAVPTTTKSVAVKLKPPKRKTVAGAPKKLAKAKVKKVVKKKKGKVAPIVVKDEEEQWNAEAAELNESELKAIKEEFSGRGDEEKGFKDLPGAEAKA